MSQSGNGMNALQVLHNDRIAAGYLLPRGPEGPEGKEGNAPDRRSRGLIVLVRVVLGPVDVIV